MVFDLYFNISSKAVERAVTAMIIAGAIYIAKDLVDEMKDDPEEVITMEG